MKVTARAVVSVDMDELWRSAEVFGGDAGFFQHFSHRRIGWFFAGIDVAARLEPNTEAFVAME